MSIDEAARIEEVEKKEAAAKAALSFDKATPFTVLGTPLLNKGRSQTLVGLAPQLWLHAKIYSDEAERHLHSHNSEDHAFFLLSGQATFQDEEGNFTELGPYEGIMIPRGVKYSFENSGEGNLVMLRIGAGEKSDHTERGRVKAGAPTVWTPDADRRQEFSGEVFKGLEK